MSENLKVFFNDVSKTSLLTHEEEIALSQRIEKGDQSARNRMIQANIRLAISIAKKYQNKGCDLQDLIQESNIGLMKAVDLFDWRKGFKFSTYACWWIKQSIRRHISSHSSAMKMPSYARGLMWKMKNAREEYEDEFGSSPSTEELADILGVSPKTLKNIIACSSYTTSLDAQVDYGNSGSSNNRKTLELIEDTRNESIDDILDKRVITDTVRKVLKTLSAREEKVLRLRFGISDPPEDMTMFRMSDSEKKELANRKKGIR